MVAVHVGIENWSLVKSTAKVVSFLTCCNRFFLRVFMIYCNIGCVFTSSVYDAKIGRKCLPTQKNNYANYENFLAKVVVFYFPAMFWRKKCASCYIIAIQHFLCRD